MANGSKKTYKVTEKQMDLICSIINTVIDRSNGTLNGEWDVETNGMFHDDESWGFVCGDDIEDSEDDVIASLEWVLKDCFDEK